MADCPRAQLDLLGAVGGIFRQGFAGRFRGIGRRAYARGHYPGQFPVVRDDSQCLAHLALDLRGFGLIGSRALDAGVVLPKHHHQLVPDSHELCVELHEFFSRAVTLHFDLQAKLFQQLCQGANDPPLLVDGRGFCLGENSFSCGLGGIGGDIRQTRGYFAGSQQGDKSAQIIADLPLLGDPLLDVCIRELLGADRIAELLLLLKELAHALRRLHQNAAAGQLQGGHDLLKTRDDGPLGFAGLDEVGGCQLRYRLGHCGHDAGRFQGPAGIRGQRPQFFLLLGGIFQSLFQTHAKQIQSLLRLNGSRNGAFVLVVQGERGFMDEVLPGEEESHSLDKLGQLSPQAQTLPFGQKPKQDLVHLLVGLFIELSPLLALGRMGLGEQVDGFGHLVLDQVPGPLLHVLQVAIERQLGHLVFFQLL